MKQPEYLYPLSIQLAMPESLNSPEFLCILDTLRRYGFSGIELNITDFERYAPTDYIGLLKEYGLRLTMIATGAYAKAKRLSLTDESDAERLRAVSELQRILAFARETGSGVICGFLKGSAGTERRAAEQRMLDSLRRLNDAARREQVEVLLEATNHYETSAAIGLQETVGLLDELKNPCFRVLPDTYHMNIEEPDSVYALMRCRGRYSSVHLSDNNRRFPGLGGMDFYPILAALKGMDYRGGLAVEGSCGTDLCGEIALSAEYLAGVSRRAARLI